MKRSFLPIGRASLFLLALGAIAASGLAGSSAAEPATRTIAADDFKQGTDNWSPYALESGKGVSVDAKNGRLRLSGVSKTASGLFLKKPVQGHFEAQVDLPVYSDVPVGLMLMREKNGKPDLGNWISFERRRNKAGEMVLRVHGMTDGDRMQMEKSALKTKKESRDEFSHEAEINEHSSTLKVFRNDLGKALHFYYRFQADIDGKTVSGWHELPTMRDDAGGRFFVALFTYTPHGKSVSGQFSHFFLRSLPLQDISDESTGFRATRRPYVWSGHQGDAVVVSFDKEMPFYEKQKFVFWSEANYIPWWHADNRAAVSYEFVETWGGGTKGCAEPMSDRLLRWTHVKIIESSPARVVVKWSYVLADSSYRWWGLDKSTRPWVHEYYTFYPDGVGIRRMDFAAGRAALEIEKWGHELSELLFVSGSGSRASRVLEETALTMMNLKGDKDNYTWNLTGPKRIGEWNPDRKKWDEIIVRVNLKPEYPSVFEVFGQGKEHRDRICPAAPIRPGGKFELKGRSGGEYAWPDGKKDFGGFSHWPISKLPYPDNPWVGAKYIREQKHTSLCSITSCWPVPRWKEGEEKRTFAVLIGLVDRKSDQGLLDLSSSWLYPGTIAVMADSGQFVEYDYYQRGYVLSIKKGGTRCAFELRPKSKVVNPVFIIKNWRSKRIALTMNGKPMERDRYRIGRGADSGLVVWVKAVVDAKAQFSIQSE